MGIFDLRKESVIADPGEIIFDKLCSLRSDKDIQIYPVVDLNARTFALSIYNKINGTFEYRGDVVCFDYLICDPEHGDTQDESSIRRDIGELLKCLNIRDRLSIMINAHYADPDLYPQTVLKVHITKAMLTYFYTKNFKFKVFGEPRLYLCDLLESLLRGLTSTTNKRYHLSISEEDKLVVLDGNYTHVFTEKEDTEVFELLIKESEKGFIESTTVDRMVNIIKKKSNVMTTDSFINVIKNKTNNKKGECKEMVENKLTTAVKERIKSVLQNKVIWDLLDKDLPEGFIGMNVSKDLKLEIQEYDILLLDRETGDVAEAYANVERALNEDRIFKFIDEYCKPEVIFDSVGTVFVDGNTFDDDAIGLWTDGTKFLYLDKYSNELIFSKNSKEDIECINTIDLLNFENCVEEYSDKFNNQLYMNIRNTLISDENKEFLDEIRTFLDSDEKLNRKKCNEISRKVGLIGLKSFESIGKYYISTIVDEFCSSRSVDLTFIITEDKAMVLISRVDKLDVVRDIELDPTFAENDTVTVEFIEKLLVQVDTIKAEVLEEK